MIKIKTDSSTHFGDELNRVRKDAKHTWDSLAAAIMTSRSQLGNRCTMITWSDVTTLDVSLRCGHPRPPRSHVIRAIAAACGVSPVSLYLAAAKDTGELSIDTTGLTVQEVRTLLHQIAEETC